MTSVPCGYLEERTPLLIGVEGLGTPAIRSSPTLYTEVDAAEKKVVNHKPCIQYNGHNMADSMVASNSKQARKKLMIACAICLVFLVGEFVGGYLANSLAIITDAAHLLSDFASFLISLLAIWFATRPSTPTLSYGWHRAEVMGALLSVLIIWVLTGVLVYKAVQRIISGEHHVNADIMLIVAACGVAVNIVMGLVLGHSHGGGGGSHNHGHSHGGGSSHNHHGHEKKTLSITLPSVKKQATDENVNVRAAFVHVIGDLFQSVGVLIAAFIIKFKPEYSIADPICTFVFSVIVLITTVTVLRDALVVLMEGTPQGVDLDEIKENILNISGVRAVHDLHVWSLTVGTTALSAHVTIENENEAQRILSEASTLVSVVYHIKHSTIQIEKLHEHDTAEDYIA